MTRANIVTLYNSKNCGAFLQSFALGDVLRDMTGCTPRYVETGARLPKGGFVYGVKAAVKKAAGRLFKIEKWALPAAASANFDRALADYDVVSTDFVFGDSDLLVFGSDEVWNLGRKDITDYPALWGSGLTGGVRVSYAPAANGADLVSAPCADDFKRSLDGFALLSARDPVTQRSVSEVTGRDVAVVCDPTMLLQADRYRELQHDTDLESYLLVYSYGTNMTEADIAAIQGFARLRGLKIVSGGFCLPWCDVCVPAGPFDFLGLMDKADYVVTDTFHGTVFASIYHKCYGSYGRTNSKVIEFMRAYGLCDRMVVDGRSIEDCLLAEPDFTAFDACWSEIRDSSLDYLRRAVALCS